MAAIAVVGVLAFLIFLIGRSVSLSRGVPAGSIGGRWYQYLLAAILLLIAIILGVWQFSTYGLLGQAVDWRADGRAITFFVIMLIVAGLGLSAFVVYLIVQTARQGNQTPSQAIADVDVGGSKSPPVETQPTSVGVRLLGLVSLFVAFLLLNWIYLSEIEQHFAVLHFLYPAAMAVALVLLFDKAARGWNVKNGAENFREWLLCDMITFLLILGFLNLRQYGDGENYASMFWDVLYISLFFLTFWILDRTSTRFRFLWAHAYLIALPILLLIWRAVQGAAMPAELSWWSSIWPFFFLAIIAFVLEIIVILLQRGENKQYLGAIKDTLFVAAYGILLIVAVPEAAA